LVGTSRRRGASEALSSSDGIGPSLINAEFMTQPLDLILDVWPERTGGRCRRGRPWHLPARPTGRAPAQASVRPHRAALPPVHAPLALLDQDFEGAVRVSTSVVTRPLCHLSASANAVDPCPQCAVTWARNDREQPDQSWRDVPRRIGHRHPKKGSSCERATMGGALCRRGCAAQLDGRSVRERSGTSVEVRDQVARSATDRA